MVNIIIMSKAVTVPNLMMMTLIVSKESFARDRHTDTQRLGSVIFLTVFFANKKAQQH